MNDDNVAVGTKRFEICTDVNGVKNIDTGINVLVKDFSELSEYQVSFDTINNVMTICDEFKKVYPNFTKSTDKLLSIFFARLKDLGNMVKDKYGILLTDAGYTLADIEDAGLVTAIHYETLNIILLKEEMN